MFFHHTIKNGKTQCKESEWLPVWVGPRRTCPLSCKPAPTGHHRHLAVWTRKCVATRTLILLKESHMYYTMKKRERQRQGKYKDDPKSHVYIHCIIKHLLNTYDRLCTCLLIKYWFSNSVIFLGLAWKRRSYHYCHYL